MGSQDCVAGDSCPDNPGPPSQWHLGATKGNGTNSSITAPPPTAYGIDESCTFNSNDPCAADGKTANSSASIIDSAIGFINRTAALPEEQPFYLNVWLHVSHNLLNPSEAQKNECVAASGRCQCGDLADNQTTCAHQIFWAAQQDADLQIGRLLAYLHDSNLMESTLIAFSTDNGPEEQMVYQAAVGSAGPFRGRKRSLYEGGIRVPFIVSWGGTTPHPRVAPRTVDNTLIGAVDWFPTVAALANVSLAGLEFDGEDMSAAIVRLNDNLVDTPATVVRPPAPRPAKPMLFWEWRFPIGGPCTSGSPQLAVRDGRFKLLRDIADGGRVELYDLSFSRNGSRPDYHEDFNLAALPGAPYQDVIDRLSKAVLEWHSHLPGGPYRKAPPCSAFPYPGLPPASAMATDVEQTGAWEDSDPEP